jgi:chemotaxis protein histidine kinase CheA
VSLVDEGQSVCLQLSDDGRGIDRAAVRARLGASAEGLDDRELLATLLRAGVSTRETVTELSGRGVGLGSLAVVAQDLRGDATLESEPQRGTTLELRLPLKVSLLRGLLVQAAGCRFILPADGLVSVRTPWPSAVPLAELLGLAAVGAQDQIVVLRGRNGPAGIAVDQIGALREVVRRPLGAHLGRAPFVEGATVLSDRDPALILDPRELADACAERTAVPAASRAGGRRVLLVDDSLTLRASLEHALTKAGYAVQLAGDGVAALELLEGAEFDAIVSDVQMPRMDGWQLLERSGGRVPFVLVTACPEADGLRRARRSGAFAYLAKDELLGERVVASLETALSHLQESSP